mmetsp:Transcript_30376/g.90020  ORF Transcript_30376/g.90020 Transcript_30376/m.90020 type:complete len:109 (-) Transcript_30376:59-385(-)
MSGLNESMMSTATRKPTGMKGKVHDLAATLQNQNDELNIDKGRLRAVLDDSSNSNSGMQGRINTMKNYFDAEVNRMLEDFKGEKTSIHQQIIALQRRIEEIEEEIGHE